jgi:uroporphyrin-III C-methyltransferase
MAGDTPVLVASNISLAGEKLVHTRLDLLPVAIDAAAGGEAALILIGEATRPRTGRGDRQRTTASSESRSRSLRQKAPATRSGQ